MTEVIAHKPAIATIYYNHYENNPKYHFYENRNPEIDETREFVEGKTSIEVTMVMKPAFGLRAYCFWFFNSENKTDVSDFFTTFYKE